MHGSRAALPFALSLGLCSIVFARHARADEKTELAAESAFAEGARLMKADRCAEAVVKFRESQRLDPASGTALNIGYCEAKLGRIASAWLAYRQAHRLAQTQGKPQHEALAREQADKLEPDVPHLVALIAADQPAGVALLLDGAPLEREMWSVPIPLDPGAHRLERRASGASPWEKAITVKRGERITVEVPSVASTASLPAVVTPPPPTTQAKPSARPTPPVDEAPRETSSSQRTWGYVLGGVGAAAFLTGAALFVSARVEYDGAADDCRDGCNEKGFAARDSARSRAFIGYGVAGAGVAIGGIGLALALTASGDAKSADRSGPVIGNAQTPWALGWRTTY
jgi:hypothetical protein